MKPPQVVDDSAIYIVKIRKVPAPALEPSVRSWELIKQADGPSRQGTVREESKAWLFQSNPRLYDLRAALAALKQQVWSVSRYAKEIKIGDQVFLWEAGLAGGIIGLAEISEMPRLRPEPWEQLPFVKVHEVFLRERLRAGLRILRVLDPLVLRQTIVTQKELMSLGVLRCSRGTNFRLTEREAHALNSLIWKWAA
jgi:EVE domain